MRMEAAGVFAGGLGNAAIAKELPVCVRSVQRWRQSWQENGQPALCSHGPALRAEAE
ncbi:helix-turn-helix domain-containing protein [Streptomyces sp. NPDC057705]|uniref:helix-turn-helix domain-containing protein n=1 Tax=Streptomyces sp. NPDC057705 TaxID=3346222 RepID=UPI0036AE91F6